MEASPTKHCREVGIQTDDEMFAKEIVEIFQRLEEQMYELHRVIKTNIYGLLT
jgi:hypothetical protein